MLIGQTAWDVTRFADRVKGSVLPDSGIVSDADARLNVYFEQAAFGDITEPAAIIDEHGRVMVWQLPGVLHPMRLVSMLYNMVSAM